MYSGTVKQWTAESSRECEGVGQLRVHQRWMIRRDMAEVLEIERQSFEFPWFEEEFIRCLRERDIISRVAEYEDRIVGFKIYQLLKTRLRLVNFAVVESARRRKVGTQMVGELIAKLRAQRRTSISLEIRESCLAGQVFFRSCGFKATNVLHEFYDDSPEDAILMQYTVNEAASEVRK